jgi:FMN reductase [NAD(P)H]
MNTKEAIEKRRTIRRFKQELVTDNEIRELLNAARLASCGGNMQRIRFKAIKNIDIVKKIFDETAWGGLVKPNRNPEWGENAPLSFILLTGPEKGGTLIHADAGAAIENMQLCATEMGIGCCWIGAFKKEPVSEIVSLPEGREALYLVAVGYPDESPVKEDIDTNGSPKYYLDDNDCLHVPKYTVDALTDWI